jgi:hypothetical protein
MTIHQKNRPDRRAPGRLDKRLPANTIHPLRKKQFYHSNGPITIGPYGKIAIRNGNGFPAKHPRRDNPRVVKNEPVPFPQNTQNIPKRQVLQPLTPAPHTKQPAPVPFHKRVPRY